jgi:hypothetical protein
MNVTKMKQKIKTSKIEKKCKLQIWVKNFITRRCGPNHYAIQSFFNGLNQFQYSGIIVAFGLT